VDFQADKMGADDLVRAVRGLQTAGCTRFLLTLITDDWSRMMARLRRFRALRANSPVLTAAIAGWHVEGPFLSAEPGFCGAHDPHYLCDPTLERIQELRAITQADPVLLTLAPERKGSLEAIRLAIRLGMVVSLGHTNADAARLAQAMSAGATGFTHLGNGCPHSLDRTDNILWRALESRGLMFSLVPDRIHVSPPLFRLIHRLIPVDSVIYVTDAMAAAAAPAGRYRLGHVELEVGTDQVVRQPGQANLAGSALRPVEAVFRAAEMLGTPWQSAWDRHSVAPAEWMGWPFPLAVGQPADFCLLKVSPAGQFEDLKVYAGGELVR
jgi:N-acetylglucosamine-6-phosphate deacetylase